MAPLTPLIENAKAAIQVMHQNGMDLAIVSINWSAQWIQIVIGDESVAASE